MRGGVIAAVGSDADVVPRAGPATEIIDLQGKCVLPGLIDSHCHPSAAALAETDHERPAMECIDDVLRYVASRAAALPAGEWIFIGQRFLTRLKEHRYPTRAERLRYFIPLRTWLDEGAIVAGGSDHMIGYDQDTSINFFNPFMGMWVAITRCAKWVEAPVTPQESLSREQAIRLYTTNAAFVAWTEKSVGSLEPGKLADCIVIDRNILPCPIDDIRTTRVERTYVGGKLVYTR